MVGRMSRHVQLYDQRKWCVGRRLVKLLNLIVTMEKKCEANNRQIDGNGQR